MLAFSLFNHGLLIQVAGTQLRFPIIGYKALINRSHPDYIFDAKIGVSVICITKIKSME